MNHVEPSVMDALWHDADARDVLLRRTVAERLAANPAPAIDDAIVATYFFAFRTQTLASAVSEIAYHATSGIKHPPSGSLLAECTATAAGVDPFVSTGRIGLLHVGFPL
jgi:hypothetical protein